VIAPAATPPMAAPAMATPPAGAPDLARVAAAAQQFEAMALNQLLAPMFDTVDTSGGPFGGGAGEQAWKPMLVQELSRKIAQAGGLGIARPVMQQMLRMQEMAHGNT
jgi:peptidoglycan hydrolase FlgJ